MESFELKRGWYTIGCNGGSPFPFFFARKVVPFSQRRQQEILEELLWAFPPKRWSMKRRQEFQRQKEVQMEKAFPFFFCVACLEREKTPHPFCSWNLQFDGRSIAWEYRKRWETYIKEIVDSAPEVWHLDLWMCTMPKHSSEVLLMAKWCFRKSRLRRHVFSSSGKRWKKILNWNHVVDVLFLGIAFTIEWSSALCWDTHVVYKRWRFKRAEERRQQRRESRAREARQCL